MKREWAVILFVFAALVGTLIFVHSTSTPPSEAELIRKFYTHRQLYEHLRDMAASDEQLIRLGAWGVETTESGIHRPPDGDFPINRYHEYLGLLKEVGGVGVSRGRGKYPESISILVWAHGWAADTRHIHICWVKSPPVNQTDSLDAYYRRSKPRQPVFRHIDDDWYLWADW